jgi:hypothetical protein
MVEALATTALAQPVIGLRTGLTSLTIAEGWQYSVSRARARIRQAVRERGRGRVYVLPWRLSRRLGGDADSLL